MVNYCRIEICATKELFSFPLDVFCLRRRFTTLNSWAVTVLRLVLNHSLVTVDVFVVVLP